jgi:hypothetical protein
MEKDRVVNKVIRDMKAFEILQEGKEGEARILVNAVWVAAHEHTIKELLAHNKKAVIQFNQEGQEMASYPSIIEAALANHCSRDVVDDSITGRVPFTRKGKYYFRYADNVKA